MMDEPKPVEMRVKQHGAVRVNAASVYREAPGIVCIYVDMHSKYVEPPMVGGGDGETPTLYFTPGDHALHLDESKPRDSFTVVEFPEYVGWNVFACDGPARYTLGVVLVAPEESAAQQPAAVDGAIDKARFERAPCYLCGYNGPGYYQPDTHPCAAKYHADKAFKKVKLP